MRIHEKLLDRFASMAEAKNLPPRSDMYIADMQEIDPLKCTALIGYDAHTAGAPTLSQLERFVEATFHGKVHAQTSTASLHEPHSAVSVCLTMHTDARPVTDATVMRRITATAYQDDSTGSIWQVVDNGQQKMLIRRVDENIADIVAARLSRPDGRRTASFGQVKQAAPMLTKGDTVRFFDGTMPVIGKVSSINGDKVTVSVGSASHAVDRSAVFNVVERADAQLSNEQNTLEDYYARAFGNSDFAKQLTRKLNQQEHPTGEDTGWTGTTGLGRS